MKIALVADIHGNSIGLDLVLADIENHNVDGYWFLGDYCTVGYDPVGVLERITKLPNAIFIRGNADRYVAQNTYPEPTLDKVRENFDFIHAYAEVRASFGWVRGAVTQAGWLTWLQALPLEQRVTLPDGTTVLLVHALPEHDDSKIGFHPKTPDDTLAEWSKHCVEEVILVGHTHRHDERLVAGKHWFNPGSVGNPLTEGLPARYGILEADEQGYTLTHHKIDYDVQQVIDAIHQANAPGKEYVISFYTGRRMIGL